ncbi:MAG: hypothetical protein AAF514_00680 [Verrucomicrobiota bacterium]
MGIFDIFSRKKKDEPENVVPISDDSGDSIEVLVNNLPESNLTVRALNALDFAMPGEWTNTTNFDTLVKNVTGEEDPEFLQMVKNRALELYTSPNEGYQSAIKIYRRVDIADKALGASAMADKLSQKIKLLSFLDKLTPKADTAQSIDLGVKVAAELIAFTKINGIPGESFQDFVKALADYGTDSKMRMTALICFDGVIPLGPDFINKVGGTVTNLTPTALQENKTFQRLKDFIPGGDGDGKLGYVKKGFGAVTGWMDSFAKDKDLSGEKIMESMTKFIEVSDDKLDYLGAFLDMSTNYYEHTGTQSVASRIIERASNEV